MKLGCGCSVGELACLGELAWVWWETCLLVVVVGVSSLGGGVSCVGVFFSPV